MAEGEGAAAFLIASACHQGKSLVKMASALPCFCPTQVSILDFCAGWHCSAAEKISNRFPKPVSDKAESLDRSRPWAPYSLRLRNGN
jgi:hypothetical protein